MDRAKNVEELVKEIADLLSIGERVSYNLNSLEFADLNQMNLDEYDEYLDMEELPEDIEEELQDWQIELVKYLRWALELPNVIDPPRTWEQLEWMADFANEQPTNSRFIRDVQRALDSRHPFSAFKNVMDYYNLLNEWYSYRDECYLDYVREEILT